MERSLKIIIAIRWIQWALSAFSFGVCLAYFLVDVTFYFWISTMFRAQVGLAGALHAYAYLAAIWVSVKPQGPLAWAILDVLFGLVAAAVAVTSQPSISEYCPATPTTLYWSDAKFAYVPLSQRTPSDTSDLTTGLTASYSGRACGLIIGVVAASGIYVILSVITAVMQFKLHKEMRKIEDSYMTQEEKQMERRKTRLRKSLARPFTRHQFDLEGRQTFI